MQMHYLHPTEAKWVLEQSDKAMQRLMEPQEPHSTTKDHGTVHGWWHSLRSALGAAGSELRGLEPVDDKR